MKNRALVLGIFALLACTGGSNAASITIQNGDFTDPTLADGAFTAYAGTGTGVPDWNTGTGYIGIQNFTGTGDYLSMPTASPNAAFDDGSNSNGPASFYQDLTGDDLLDDVAAGTYTLDVYGGWRTDKSWPGGSISLMTTTGDVLGTANLIQPVVQGTFALTPLVVNIPLGDGDIGEQLRVQLATNGNSTGFDDVTLNFQAIPEPSTWAMLLAGGALLGFGVHRHALSCA